ncbi:hypothetical protein ScPMuIL_002099, partial [Solemya velum]
TETGACTNLIENKWWCIKRLLPSMHSKQKNFGSILLNMYRNIYLSFDLFGRFLSDRTRTNLFQ